MTAAEILAQAVEGSLTEEQALEQLVALGMDRADAEEQIYLAKGGDDVVAN